MFALCNPNVTGLIQREHTEIFARIGVGCWKSGFRRTKALISLKRGKIGPGYYWSRIGSHTRAFDWCQNQWPLMTLKGHYALCFKTRASFGAHCENLNEDGSIHCQRQRCSPMTLVSANIRFVPIFEGVHWREGVKRQWGNQNMDFSRLSTLGLQHVKKWDERY